MSLPFRFISITANGKNWLIPMSVLNPVIDSTPHFICMGTSGFLEPGESDAEAMERTFSHGAILPLNPRLQGRDLMMEIGIYSKNQSGVNVAALYKEFADAVTAGNFTVQTNYPHSFDVTYQSIQITRVDLLGRGRMTFKLFMKAAQG